MEKIETSVIYKNGKPFLIILEYLVSLSKSDADPISEFRLSYYPHLLEDFTKLMDQSFKEHESHGIYGDFKHLDQIKNPGFYIHVLQKKKSK